MTTAEIFVLTMILFGAVIGISYVYRLKQIKKADEDRRALKQAEYESKFARMKERERQEDLERQKLRQHPNYGNPQFDPRNPDVLKPRETVAAQKRRYQTQTVNNNDSAVYVDSSNDLLNAMLLNRMLMTDSDRVSGTISWNDSSPTVREESVTSYTSTYSSSDSDDSSKRSSYSSDSSDSSYSSSSSDSSSSSWD